MSSIPDDVLVNQAKDGNMESFEMLVEKYQKNVYNIAFRFVGNKEDAYDLAQEAFIKAYKGLKNFRQDATFKTWMYHITSNVCRDFLKKTKKVKELSLNEPLTTDDGDMEKQLADGSKGPEELYESYELSKFVQTMIDSLPDDYKEIIILREIQQLSYEEIAEVLQCSLGTVKSRLNRARKALREKICKVKEQNKLELRQTN